MREVQPPGDASERFSGTEHKEDGEKHRRPGRLLGVFKGLVMLVLLAATAYGMLDAGLYRDELWLPVAAGILALLFVTLFVRGFYWDLPSVGILLVGLLAALVAVKGLSMVWTISETETIKETLRSSMYLAAFLMALAALTSGRQVGSLIDASVVMVAAVAGYGLLQKISPIEYPVRSLDGVRMDSTLGYANTTAVILGMGVVLALARMSTLRSFVLRGLYAAVTLSFFIALYLTVSRGGIGSLGIGLIVLFVFTSGRLRMLADLLLLSLPGAWLWWQMQSLPGLLGTDVSRQQKIADGTLFRNDLIVALLVCLCAAGRLHFPDEPLRASLTGAQAEARNPRRGRRSACGRIGRFRRRRQVRRSRAGLLDAPRQRERDRERRPEARLARYKLQGRLLEGRLGGVEGAPPHRYGGRDLPVHVAGGQTGAQGRQTGPQRVSRAGHRVRLVRLSGPAWVCGCPRRLHREGRLALGSAGRTPAPSGRAGLRAHGLPRLLGVRVALVPPGLDAFLLYPRRRRSEVRLQGGLGCRRGSHRRQWG